MLKQPNTERFDFLEGLRALAMLVVLNFHALTSVPANAPDQPIVALLQRYTFHGQAGVVVFIVLSGYCLTLPIARSSDGKLRGGILGFAWRRSRRILPAYYAALAASILVAWAVTAVHSRHGSEIRSFSNVLTPKNILAHLFLVHNLWFDTAFSLNGPLWSVATEWQIYFVFALLLLPLLRKLGIVPVVLLAFTAGILPSLLLPANESFYWARPWYLGLFALGMAGAVVSFPERARIQKFTDRLSFEWIFLGLAASLLAIHFSFGLAPSWPIDTLIGLCTVAFICHCTQVRRRTTDGSSGLLGSRFVGIFEQPWLMRLAGISYSIYLIQHIFFKGVVTLAEARHASALSVVLLNYLVAIPMSTAAACLLARYFERPFLSSRTEMQSLISSRAYICRKSI